MKNNLTTKKIKEIANKIKDKQEREKLHQEKLTEYLSRQNTEKLSFQSLKKICQDNAAKRYIDDIRSFMQNCYPELEIDYRRRSFWEFYYRKWIGVLPEEQFEQGYGCINGTNIFKYGDCWRVFGLNSQYATAKDLKESYQRLIEIYHPDNSQTGDEVILKRIDQMYQSIVFILKDEE